jgi:hypothetical protein
MEYRSLKILVATAGVLLLAVLLYWPGLAGPFILDDAQNIVKVQLGDPDFDSILYTITHNGSGPLGRGVSVLSFIGTTLLHGNEAWGFKFHNLLIHLVNGLLICRLLYVSLPLLAPGLNANRILLIAGVVSSFWLLHPLLVSTVLYAVQRMTQLAVLFSLLALLAYMRMRHSVGQQRRFCVYGWVLFPLCLLLAMLSKETGVMIPVYILAFEVLVFRSAAADIRDNRYLQLWLLVFVALPLLLGSYFVVTHFGQIANYSNRTFTLAERLLTQVHALFFYARLILFPRISAMSLYQDDFPVTNSMDPVTALLACLLLSLPVAIWFMRKKMPVPAFGLAWFLISHLLESSFIPLELVFEHRNYLAAVGLLLPPVHYVFADRARQPLQWVFAALFLVLLLQTFSRVQEWSNEEMLISLAVTDHPASVRARVSYANFLFNRARTEEGLEQLRIAGELNEQDAGTTLHMLSYLCVQGVRNEDLVTRAEMLLRTYPITVYAANAIENLLTLANDDKCTVITHAELKRLIEAALAMPRNTENSDYHGYLLRFLGIHAFMEGRYAEGVIAFRMGHEVSGKVVILSELVRYQIAVGRLDDAADTLRYIEMLNDESFGLENYTVAQLQSTLDAASQARSAPQAPAAETVTAEPRP